MDLSHYRTTAEAAKELGISRQQVSHLCKRGVLPSQTIGGSYLIPLKAIITYRAAEQRKYVSFAMRKIISEKEKKNV